MLKINGDRLWNNLMTMAKIGATPKGGVCRVALTEEDRIGRDLFIEWCKKAGLSLEIDRMGNIFARRSGKNNDLPPVMAGSHLDSQPTGGKYDGVYGVLAAFEVIETLNDHNIITEHPIEIVSWTNEEGARFAPAMIGSGVFSGDFTLEISLKLNNTQQSSRWKSAVTPYQQHQKVRRKNSMQETLEGDIYQPYGIVAFDYCFP